MAIPDPCAGSIGEETICDCGESKVMMTTTSPGGESFEETLLEVCGKLAFTMINENSKKEERMNYSDDINMCASDDNPLLPGLPDHISKLMLAGMPRESFPGLQLVNKSWKRFFQSEELIELRRQVSVLTLLRVRGRLARSVVLCVLNLCRLFGISQLVPVAARFCMLSSGERNSTQSSALLPPSVTELRNQLCRAFLQQPAMPSHITRLRF